jgi:beta-lactam-binding protein with PASTA domain
LANAGLGWHVTYVPSLTPFNIVIQQTPVHGTSVAIGTVVDLLVSSGSVILPNELNKAVDIAVAELLALGLFPQITQKPTTKVPPGLVTKQVPGPGQRLLVGQPVFLEVSVQPLAGAEDNLLPSLNDIVNVVTVVQ